jgi:hypothetical protein
MCDKTLLSLRVQLLCISGRALGKKANPERRFCQPHHRAEDGPVMEWLRLWGNVWQHAPG